MCGFKRVIGVMGHLLNSISLAYLLVLKLKTSQSWCYQTRDIFGEETVHDALEYLDIDLPAEVQAYGLPNAIFSTTECGGSAIIYSFQGHLIPSIGLAGQLRSAAMMAAMVCVLYQNDLPSVVPIISSIAAFYKYNAMRRLSSQVFGLFLI